MTMPTFEPVATVYEDTLIYGAALPYGTPLFTFEQLQQAYEAGKAAQVEQEPLGKLRVYPSEESECGVEYDIVANGLQHQKLEKMDGAVLYAAPPAPAVPDGFMLVPTTATAEMIAAAEEVEDLYRRGTPDTWAKVFRAMVAASPLPEDI